MHRHHPAPANAQAYPFRIWLIDYAQKLSKTIQQSQTPTLTSIMARMDDLPSEIVLHIAQCRNKLPLLKNPRADRMNSSGTPRHRHSPACIPPIPHTWSRRNPLARTVLHRIEVSRQPPPPQRTDSSGVRPGASIP